MPTQEQLLATPISKLPYGLLSLFGIKSQGSYPLYLRNDWQIGLDLLDLMAAAHGENVTDLENNISLTGFAEILTVPQTQIWFVRYCTLRVTTGAAATVTGFFVIQPTQPAAQVYALSSTIQLAASGTTIVTAGPGPTCGGFWLSQGDQLGFFVTAITGADTDTIVDARILRLPI